MNVELHKPINQVSGIVTPPGSKSISNRILIIKALSGLDIEIKNLSNSDDTNHLKKALTNYVSQTIIDVGHAGTDMRFLTAFLSLKNGDYELTGSERLQQRPIKDLVEVLKKLGADITYKKNEGFPPLQIKGKQLTGGVVEISGSVSSQFITALLLVAPYFRNGLDLIIKDELVSKPYVDMTIALMKEFGAAVDWCENKISVLPISYSYDKKEFIVESDWSAASYYYSIIALSTVGTKLILKNLFKNSLQADSECENIYRSLGVETEFKKNEIVVSKTHHTNHTTLALDFIQCPDIAQTVVCSCIGLKVPFVFNGLQTLKIKETDRIIALKNELKKFGYVMEITDNSIKWINQKVIANDNLSIATYNDHRMAMSFTPLCLLHENIVIENAEVVSKSYPLFWEDLKHIGINQTLV